MSILKIRDKDGNIQEILALKGEKGERGEQGQRGESGIVEPLIVALNDDQTQASHTPTQMYEHMQNGGVVYLARGDGALFSLSRIWRNIDDPDNSEALFCEAGTDELWIGGYQVFGDGSVYYSESWGIPAGSMDPLIVKLDNYDSNTASHTSREIQERVLYGVDVYLDIGDSIRLPLHGVDLFNNDPYAYFSSVHADELIIQTWEIRSDGSVSYYEKYCASSAYVYELAGTVGDIETALDSIIAIQNQLIGGDEA